ncbi:helix-turn-helix domain-containing protein [Halogeometricum limi]|uniref:helix-turn-helix domain-containing protein n=1 Tax=Halogeometricum limi TaxID=555875 RepID=UPI000B7E2B08|nr:helix-turn-helix domain-containing protein [Halogeometricum limi]
MRHVRFSASPEGALRRPLFDLLAASDWVRETRLVNWTLGGERPAALFVVRGDSVRFEAALAGVPDVHAYDVQHTGGPWFALHVTLVATMPLTALFDALTRGGLVVVRPMVYRGGRVRGNLVGPADDVARAVETLTDGVAFEVESVTEFDVGGEFPAATLTDRQLTVVRAAVERGYYDAPRGTTHERLADELGLSASTVGEHLRRAEAKLVRGSLAGYD